MKWMWNVLIGFDQLVNAIFGGDPDETISSRAAKDYAKGRLWARLMCRFLHLFDKNHCDKSLTPEEGKDEVW